MEPNGIGALVNAVRERFPNLTQAGISNCRSMPMQEPVQVAKPFTEFWAKGTGASKIENRSMTPFPRPPGEGTGPTEHSCQQK